MHAIPVRASFLRLVLLALPALLPAQASFQWFGASCYPGLSMAAGSLPRLGRSFDLLYQGPYGSVFVGTRTQVSTPLLLIGLSNTSAGGLPLPFLLPLAVTGGQPGCQVLVAPDAIVAMANNLSTPPPYVLSLPIPSNQALLGLRVFVQWCTLTATSSLGGPSSARFCTSDAGVAVIGS